METKSPNPTDQSAQAAAAPQDGAPGLSTPELILQLADQLTACAEALHARIMHDIQAYQGGPVPFKVQETARRLLDDEQVLRQRADGMIADAATLVVHSLGKSQAHVLKLTADAGDKLKNLTGLYAATGIVGRLLEISAALATGNPGIIMRSLEDMQHMLDVIASHSPPVVDPGPLAFVGDTDEMIRQMRKGTPAWAVTHVAANLGLSQERLFKLLRLPESTGEGSTSKDEVLSATEQDRVYRAERVLKSAISVLEDADAAREWLSRANRSLGGEVPLAMLDTEVGYELVLDTLARIEYGVIS